MPTEIMSKFKGGADFFRDSLDGIDDLKPKREDNSDGDDNSKPEPNESTEQNHPSQQDTDDSNNKDI